MIMVHDAATTYLEGGILHQVNNWAKTQPDGGPSALLGCGARAFDWRPKAVNGKIVMHHGSVTVDHPMSDSLDEMVSWCSTNVFSEDLVVIGVTDCEGDGCIDGVEALLLERNITWVSDCSTLDGMTAAEAFQLGKLPGGGGMIAINSCWVSE
jgi:hypothetical protein